MVSIFGTDDKQNKCTLVFLSLKFRKLVHISHTSYTTFIAGSEALHAVFEHVPESNYTQVFSLQATQSLHFYDQLTKEGIVLH